MVTTSNHTPLSFTVREEAGHFKMKFADKGSDVYEYTADQATVDLVAGSRWYRGADYPYTIKAGIGAVTIHRFIGSADKNHSYDIEFLDGDRKNLSAANLRKVPRSYSARRVDKNLVRSGKLSTDLKQIQRTKEGHYYSQHSFRYAEITSIVSISQCAAIFVRDYYNWYLEPEMQTHIAKPNIPEHLEAQILLVLPRQVAAVRNHRTVAKTTPVRGIYLTNPGPNLRYEYRFNYKGKKYGGYGFVSITAAAKAYNRKIWEITTDRSRLIRLPLALRLQEAARLRQLECVGLLKNGMPVKKCSMALAKQMTLPAKIKRSGIF